ncbi:MAG: TonB-dependent receptor [Sphingomonadales bacterium]|nr:TonB-dependent receptor [Sphingomonadales bacterium]
MRRFCALAGLVLAAVPSVAQAQRAGENAVDSADDAFGTNVGLETSGIYSENDTRGFSPLKAGNFRLDGVYFDPVAQLSGRLRQVTAMRVGFAALDYPFPAPTGIADARLRTVADKLVISTGLTLAQYNGNIRELDVQVPLVKGKLGLAAGYGGACSRFVDGAFSCSDGVMLKPVLKLDGFEFSPFYSLGRGAGQTPRPLITFSALALPVMPQARTYLGQRWAEGITNQDTGGFTLRGGLAKGLTFRAGLFRSIVLRDSNYSELFAMASPTQARHLFIADPHQDVHSWSGEAQMLFRFQTGGWQQRLMAGYRFRDRHTESGGSDIRDFGMVTLGEPDAEAEPVFHYTAVNVGTVKQSSVMLGWSARREGVGQVHIGVQKARYRAEFDDARTGAVTRQADDPWLYNASVSVPVIDHLSVFAATAKGLEDSGAAPENAVNRNEQLPASQSRQYEAGLRWKGHGVTAMVSAFQITKPYFAFDAARRFDAMGQLRHRGVEASFSGHVSKRLSLVAGGVFMQPRVTGAGRDVVGARPAGTPSVYARADVNYRTDWWGGLTPTATVIYTGARAAGSCAVAGPGCVQPMLPHHATLDLGLRNRFRLGRWPASFRAVVLNVFDERAWKVLAANTLQQDDTRRVQVTVNVDF